jgi:hypothetical protein
MRYTFALSAILVFVSAALAAPMPAPTAAPVPGPSVPVSEAKCTIINDEWMYVFINKMMGLSNWQAYGQLLKKISMERSEHGWRHAPQIVYIALVFSTLYMLNQSCCRYECGGWIGLSVSAWRRDAGSNGV